MVRDICWMNQFGACGCVCRLVLSSEHETVCDTHAVEVCPAPSHSATFHWEWTGLYKLSLTCTWVLKPFHGISWLLSSSPLSVIGHFHTWEHVWRCIPSYCPSQYCRISLQYFCHFWHFPYSIHSLLVQSFWPVIIKILSVARCPSWHQAPESFGDVCFF